MKLFSDETLAHAGLEYDEDDTLSHSGVRGMKWGVRRNRAPGYEDNQVKRDQQVYGTRGANRINKNLHAGDSISVARGNEKTRRDRVMGKNKYVRQGGKVAGAVGGVVLANVAIKGTKMALQSTAGRKLLEKAFGGNNRALKSALAVIKVTELLDNPVVRVAASLGAAKVGTMFAGDVAVAANMRINGYDPSRK